MSRKSPPKLLGKWIRARFLLFVSKLKIHFLIVTQSQLHSSFVSLFPQFGRENVPSSCSVAQYRKSHANLSFNIYEFLPPATKKLIISCFFSHPVLEYTWAFCSTVASCHYNLSTRQPGLLNCHFNLNDIASSVHFRPHAAPVYLQSLGQPTLRGNRKDLLM